MANYANLRVEMAKRGVTQRQLAQRIGSTESAVSMWLKGTRSPSLRYTLKIQRVFPDCSIEYLFADVEG